MATDEETDQYSNWPTEVATGSDDVVTNDPSIRSEEDRAGKVSKKLQKRGDGRRELQPGTDQRGSVAQQRRGPSAAVVVGAG